MADDGDVVVVGGDEGVGGGEGWVGGGVEGGAEGVPCGGGVPGAVDEEDGWFGGGGGARGRGHDVRGKDGDGWLWGKR